MGKRFSSFGEIKRELRSVAKQRDKWCGVAKELARRIAAFQEQQERVRKAYVDDVMLASHGQVDIRALRDPGRYLIEMEDGSIKTYGQLLREAEEVGCKPAGNLLSSKSQ